MSLNLRIHCFSIALVILPLKQPALNNQYSMARKLSFRSTIYRPLFARGNKRGVEISVHAKLFLGRGWR